MDAYLEYTDKDGKTKKFPLRAVPDFKVVIGRSPTCNLRLDSRLVSRNHGNIVYSRGAFIYHDGGSVNGTKVNDEKVSTRKLHDNDRLKLGDQVLVFHIKAEEKQQKPENRPTIIPQSAGGLGAALPRLKKENDILRKRCDDMAKKLREAQKQAETAVKERDKAMQRMQELEAEVKTHRDKEVAYSIDLHNLVDRNKDLAEKIKFQQPLLEKAREDVQNIQAQNNALRAQLSESTEQLEALRKQLADYKQRIEDFKVKMTQAQREIDQIQRDNDIKDYDLRTIKEENEILREKADTIENSLREQNKKVRDFEVIIEENRRHIDELRRQIAQKNDAIDALQAQLRGDEGWDRETELQEAITEKEQQIEKLQGRVTELAGKVSAMEQEKSDLTAKIADLQKELEDARKTPADISDHPEYKDKLRLLTRLEKDNEELNRALESMQQQVEQAKSRALKAVENQLQELREQINILKKRNEDLKNAMENQPVEQTAESARVYLEELSDTLIMIADTFNTVKSFFHNLVREGVQVPNGVFSGLGITSVKEMAALLEDQIMLMKSDIKQLKKEIGG